MEQSIEIKERGFDKEFEFSASRSSGPGGQNVNKVSTKAELRFKVMESQCLSEPEKELIMQKLKNKINTEGELIISSQLSRSLIKNKELCINKFYKIIEDALRPRKKRIKTQVTVSMKENRLKNKRLQSEKKTLRQNPED